MLGNISLFIYEYCCYILAAWLILYIIIKMLSKKDLMPELALGIFNAVSSIVYALALLCLTLLSRTVYPEHNYELSVLWEYRAAFMFTKDGIIIESGEWLCQITMNIILFIPLGVLYGEFVHNISWKKAALTGAVISFFIETTQLVARLGLFETSDILNNTIGMLAGFGIFLLVNKCDLC